MFILSKEQKMFLPNTTALNINPDGLMPSNCSIFNPSPPPPPSPSSSYQAVFVDCFKNLTNSLISIPYSVTTLQQFNFSLSGISIPFPKPPFLPDKKISTILPSSMTNQMQQVYFFSWARNAWNSNISPLLTRHNVGHFLIGLGGLLAGASQLANPAHKIYFYILGGFFAIIGAIIAERDVRIPNPMPIPLPAGTQQTTRQPTEPIRQSLLE